jgi:predicted RNA polymerase sigma factor
LPAVLAELCRESGDMERAAALYREALTRARAEPERRFLANRLDNL